MWLGKLGGGLEGEQGQTEDHLPARSPQAGEGGGQGEYLKDQDQDKLLVKAQCEHEEGEEGSSLEKGTGDGQSNDPPKDSVGGRIYG